MSEFAQIAEEVQPVFEKLTELKKKYGITSFILENLHTLDQFTVNFAEKRGYVGRRKRGNTEEMDKPFLQIK